MKEAFEFFLNIVLKDDLELLFGEGSVIVVNFIRYSTNNKCFTVDCKLLTADPELCMETYPVGLDLLVTESWKYMGIKENINLTSTIDLK
jgi:hypothetical protein